MTLHSFADLAAIITLLAGTLILALVAAYAWRLRTDLRKLQKSHFATMAIISVAANVPKICQLPAAAAFQLQEDSGMASPRSQPAWRGTANEGGSTIAGPPCPLDVEGVPRGLCPFVNVVVDDERDATDHAAFPPGGAHRKAQ
jgi:hypothetical protein